MNLKGAAARGRKRWAEYNLHRNILSRCHNPKHPQFKNYGGRGIQVCERWRGENGFRNFISDIGRKPSPSLSLDRVNNDGNYEPDNVRWATDVEQNRNTRQKRLEHFTTDQLLEEIRRRITSGKDN